MLTFLRIRNFALVEHLEWEVPPGFVAITGETGAGKSIVIGALRLLLGERANKSLIRAGATEACFEALIELPLSEKYRSSIFAFLTEAGLAPCENQQLVLKRVLTASGAGRQFVNSSLCTLSQLRQLGTLLVDLHGPYDHQSLFSREAQIRILDQFAHASSAYQEYLAARQEWLALVEEQQNQAVGHEALMREIDLLQYQLQEIELASPLMDAEDDLLLNKHRQASHAQQLSQLAHQILQQWIEGEFSVERHWMESLRTLKEMQRLDNTLTSLLEGNMSLLEEFRDSSQSLKTYTESLEINPIAIAQLEQRMDILEGLKRKYGPTLQDVIQYQEKATQQLQNLLHRNHRSQNLDLDIQRAHRHVLQSGQILSEQRKTQAPDLEQEVNHHLKDLGFTAGGFAISFIPESSPTPGLQGLESMEFLFAPNPGEPPQPLRSIASSGEISRVMLALKTALAHQDEIPVLIFDEIDANVGGEIAHSVAEKMQSISHQHQVICITHLPQVAAQAHAHVVISKATTQGRTVSQLELLTPEQRETEIARMLGNRKGPTALAHARELLGF